MSESLRKSKSIKSSPKSIKRKKVLRSEIKVRSPKSPKCIVRQKNQVKRSDKQRHLVSAVQNKQSVVSKLVNIFERNKEPLDCFDIHDKDKTSSTGKCVGESLVRNAFDLMMSQRGSNTKCKTPKGKNLKRLEPRKPTSNKKKIDQWARK